MTHQIRSKPILDLRIPLPIIAVVLVQTCTFVWWQASTQSDRDRRLETLEQWVSQNNHVIERVIRVEEKVGNLKEQTNRIEGKLDEALKRGRR